MPLGQWRLPSFLLQRRTAGFIDQPPRISSGSLCWKHRDLFYLLLAMSQTVHPLPPWLSASKECLSRLSTRPLPQRCPFADAVTMARVLGTLESRGKKVVIRQEGASSFSELEPAVSMNYCGSLFGTEYVDTSSTSGQRLTGRSDGDSLAFRTGPPRICSADAAPACG